ncbi:MAG: hypothetical protein EOO24_02680 [Comamonadaceae bacterium]|nr:MAG: hypothetical protein EOO24_02680 [Comamonadaceae bacterium]
MNNDILGHRPDPDVEALVKEASEAIMRVQQSLEAGDFPPESEPLSPERQTILSLIVKRLCDEGNFMHAAPIALRLALCHPTNGSHWFAAGRVFQRLGAFEAATSLYFLSLQQKEQRPVIVYRLGECLVGRGRTEEALHLFDAAFDLMRTDDSHRLLQEAATAAIDRLRAGARGA